MRAHLRLRGCCRNRRRVRHASQFRPASEPAREGCARGRRGCPRAQLRRVPRNCRKHPRHRGPIAGTAVAGRAPDRWLAIRTAFLAQSAARSTRRVRRPGWLLPAASAAIVLCAVLLTVSSHGPQQGPSARTPVASDVPSSSAPPQQVLVAESQRLEAVLATLPADTRVARAGTALTVAGPRGPDSLGRLSTQHGQRSGHQPAPGGPAVARARGAAEFTGGRALCRTRARAPLKTIN